LLYEAEKSLQWCARCETALAEAEVEYSDEKDPSIYVKFPLVGKPGEFVLVWTTTPWTLPANLCVAVNPKFRYAKIRVTRGPKTEHFWMVTENIKPVMDVAKIEQYQIVDEKPGSAMEGWEYTHPLAQKVPAQRALQGAWLHKVVPSDTVTAESTGCVHTAPGHGPEDFELGQKLGLPVFSPVDERGVFTQDAGEYAGKPIREANAVILDDLNAARLLFAEEDITHRYGHCWRCKTPILFRATTQWFLKVTDIKQKMLEEIERVKWFPDWAGEARQYDWTLNLRDWCLSRQRYWGIPLPLWKCAKCGRLKVVGRLDELKASPNYREGMDLHRPWVDEIAFDCPECGSVMSRIKDILDVWFDSGVSSWAQLGYPRHEDEFKRWWPMDWIVEGPDQPRGWFNSQLTAGVLCFGRSPYESVLMHGWVNGPDGRQMHKSLGNYVDPVETIDKFGADALRFFLLEVNPPWEDTNFLEEGVQHAQRTLNILWNVHKFAATYMTVDEFDPQAHTLDSVVRSLRPEDKWLLSRLENLKVAVGNEVESYSLHRACRLLEEFILNDLSRWYVKLVRARTWKEGEDREKTAAYRVLWEALSVVSRMMAPITPFLAESIYQNLDGRRLSVHMEPWPPVSEQWINNELEKQMGIAQEVVEIVSKARQKQQMKLRWPVKMIAVKAPPETAAKALKTFREVVMSQANAKDLVVLGEGQEFDGMALQIQPNPAAIGKVYKQWWSKIATMLESRPPDEVKRALDKGEYRIGIEGQIVRIAPHMVNFAKKMPADVSDVTTPHGEIYVDMRITPEIQAEGYAREVIRRIQQMRKETDLSVEDFIKGGVKVRQEFAKLLEPWKAFIAAETRCRSLAIGDVPVNEEYVVEWNVEGETFTIGVTPFHMAEALGEFTKIPHLTERKAIALYDAGYKTVSALEQATRDELAAVDGLDPGDAKRIREHFEKGGAGEPGLCPVCGADLKEGARRCERCGELLPGAAPEEPPAVVVEAPKAPPPAVEEPPEERPFVPPANCPFCDAPVPPDAVTCPSCGTNLRAAVKTAEAVAPRTVTMWGPAKAVELPELKGSSTYLVKEQAPTNSYRLFLRTMSSGRKGFCVTRVYPEKIREQYSLADVPVLWLSNVGKEDTVRPKDLEKLSLSLEQFIAHEGGIVLIDGIEYLITNNNFITVLRLVQALRDQVAINNAILVFSVNPATLDEHQLHLLEREVDAVLDMQA
ncbi:MAG: isoleucine--tRNA ligase, partial [Euryarchaeota archaeon RBG_16_68_12]